MTLELIKELRNRTGAGFLDCRKALEYSQNNLDIAIAWLKKQGTIKATKKAHAVAAQGIVQTITNDMYSVIFELNSQTDFVANNSEFKDLGHKIGKILLKNNFESIEDALNLKDHNQTIEQLITATTVKTGEKIVLRRAKKIVNKDRVIGAYTHVNNRVAAIVVAKDGNMQAVRNVAMHVASMNPQFLDENDIPKEELNKIKAKIADAEILKNKPETVKAKIASGMLKKHLSELTLVDQEFVMEKMTVADYLNQYGAKVMQMIRYELGEGIENQKTDFATEVSNQIKK